MPNQIFFVNIETIFDIVLIGSSIPQLLPWFWFVCQMTLGAEVYWFSMSMSWASSLKKSLKISCNSSNILIKFEIVSQTPTPSRFLVYEVRNCNNVNTRKCRKTNVPHSKSFALYHLMYCKALEHSCYANVWSEQFVQFRINSKCNRWGELKGEFQVLLRSINHSTNYICIRFIAITSHSIGILTTLPIQFKWSVFQFVSHLVIALSRFRYFNKLPSEDRSLVYHCNIIIFWHENGFCKFISNSLWLRPHFHKCLL